MAPVIVVELLGNSNAKIEQLHLDGALDTPKILDQIIAPSKEAAQLFPFNVGYMDTVQSTIFQFPAYKLCIDFICLGKAFLSLTMDVGRVDYQRDPTISFKTTIGIIATTASLIGRGDLVVGKMFVDILF